MARWIITKLRPRSWDLYEHVDDDNFDWQGTFSTHSDAVEAMVEIEKEEAQMKQAAREAFDELRRYEDELGINY